MSADVFRLVIVIVVLGGVLLHRLTRVITIRHAWAYLVICWSAIPLQFLPKREISWLHILGTIAAMLWFAIVAFNNREIAMPRKRYALFLIALGATSALPGLVLYLLAANN